MTNLQQLQADPARFRQSLRIDCDGHSKPLAEVIDPWQQADFTRLDPAWLQVTGKQQPDYQLRAWLERPRGHSKTSDLAVMATWALFASRRPLSGCAAAADRDQAKLLRDAIQRLCRLNPWLGSILEIQQYRIINRHSESELQIISSDAATSYGLLLDFLILDEVTHWQDRDLFDSLLSTAAKRSHCLLVSISNAGFSESWQWSVREAIRTDPDWYFSRIDGPQASWLSEKHLKEQRRLLPSIAFDRLWLNRWTAGQGDALDPDDIEASIRLNGPAKKAKPGYAFFAGLDLGLSKDKAALAVVGKHVGRYIPKLTEQRRLTDSERILVEAGIREAPAEEEAEYQIVEGTGRLKLARLEVWSPSKGQKVSIEQIEDMIVSLDADFQLAIGADPWQAAYLVQRLQSRNIQIEAVDFVPNNLRSMCTATLEAFSERNIGIFPDEQLVADLRKLQIEEKSYGVRLASPRGRDGHGDAATALAIALHMASKYSHSRRRVVDRPLICWS